MIATENTPIELRRFERFPLMLDGEVSIGAGTHACAIYEISMSGAKIRVKDVDLVAVIAPLDEVVLGISGFGGFGGEIAWTDDDYLAIRFLENYKTMISLILEDATRNR